MSRGGEAPLPVRTEGAHIFFVDPAHRVLLYLRDDQPGLLFPNTWHALGGGLEPGETPAACLRRELREELAVDAIVGGELLSTTHTYAERKVELHFFSVTLLGEPTPQIGQQMQWIRRDDLATLKLPPADDELVALLQRA